MTLAWAKWDGQWSLGLAGRVRWKCGRSRRKVTEVAACARSRVEAVIVVGISRITSFWGYSRFLPTRLTWPLNAPLCDNMVDWRVLMRLPIILHLYFIKATQKVSVIMSRKDVRTCGPQPRGKCNKPRGGITMHYFPSSWSTSYIPIEIISMAWIRGLRGFGEFTRYRDTLFLLEHMCNTRQNLWHMYPGE
jgi:hypothetical protein